jgi:hypothetical protein
MHAIETLATIDNQGFIQMSLPLRVRNKSAKIIILIEDEDNPMNLEDKLWAKAISDNTAFDFLKEEAEDIYSITDGKPFSSVPLKTM